ncbi:unnamed protein product [Paramecium octaurelia]|uniref:Uncharacterized protein n=1 Tax=Paramecium octaurelia TaxID=43137 RepID=A0A8S1XK76_PAROT|nr:unnamed protein product [Paramecium octaurelia]
MEFIVQQGSSIVMVKINLIGKLCFWLKMRISLKSSCKTAPESINNENLYDFVTLEKKGCYIIPQT